MRLRCEQWATATFPKRSPISGIRHIRLLLLWAFARKSQIMKETNLNAMKHTELCEQKVLCPISKFRENRAISKQVLEILNNSMTEITDVLRVDFSKSDLWHWSVYLRGPWGTPYDAGWFAAEFDLPPDYPFKPPRKFRILTKILHPNIWATGEVCADIFGAAWSPAITLFKMLLSIISLLDTPEPLDPANVEAASLQLNHPELFAEKARLWTQTFALQPPSLRDLGYETSLSL
jgi:ubiquitin-protein ligase